MRANTRAATPLELDELESFVRISVSSTDVSLRGGRALVAVVDNARARKRFERRNRGLRSVRCLVPVAALPAGNDAADVVERGLSLEAPLRVSAGTLPAAEIELACASALPGGGGGRVASFLVCEAAVGKPWPVAHDEGVALLEGVGAAAAEALPRGFHSFLVRGENDPDGTFAPGGRYAAAFVLPHAAAAVLPLAVVRAELASGEGVPPVPECEQCEEAEAAVYCKQDRAWLCAACDKVVHKPKVVSKHERVPAASVTRCGEHGGRQHELFCRSCAVPVCALCAAAQGGRHPPPYHDVVDLGAAYDRAAAEAGAARIGDAACRDTTRDALKEKMAAVEAKMRALAASESAATGALMQQFSGALGALRQRVDATMRELVAESLGLNRMMAEAEWLDCFLAARRGESPPAEFLAAAHARRVISASTSAPAPEPSHFGAADISTEIVVSGTVTVAPAPAAPKKRQAREQEAAGGARMVDVEGWQREALRRRLSAEAARTAPPPP